MTHHTISKPTPPSYRKTGLRKRGLLVAIHVMLCCLNGCSVMPGMQNPELAQMIGESGEVTPSVKPHLVPITPALIKQEDIAHYEYKVSPADVINVIIWQHPEFTPKELSNNQQSILPSTQGAAGRKVI